MSCGCNGNKTSGGSGGSGGTLVSSYNPNVNGNGNINRNVTFADSSSNRRYYSSTNNTLTGPNSSASKTFGIGSSFSCPPGSQQCGTARATASCPSTSACAPSSCQRSCGTSACGTSSCAPTSCPSACAPSSCQRAFDPCTDTSTSQGLGTGNGNCGQTLADPNTWPPANRSVGEGTPVRYTHIYVPGDAPNLGAALATMREDVAGYVVHLQNGTHTLNASFTRDIKYLRIEGDYAAYKGVGYINGLGQWDKAIRYNGQYNAEIGGLAPWTVGISGNRITVTGSKNPDFSTVRNGDKLVFFHADGSFTEHTACSGCKNTVTLSESVTLHNTDGTTRCDVEQGEGFFFRPHVTLKTADNTKLTVEGRLEYGGVLFKTNPTFVTGATGGFTETEHSVISGNYVHVGHADWYKPNVVTCQFTVPQSSTGTFFYQSVLGERANVQMYANPPTNYSFAMFVGNAMGLYLTNFGNAATIYTDYFRNDQGALATGGSRHDIRGSRFINNSIGVTSIQNSSLTALTTLEEDSDEVAPFFASNDLAISIDLSNLSNFDTINTSGNINTLRRDGDLFVSLDDYTSGSYGGRYSALTYGFHNIIPPP